MASDFSWALAIQIAAGTRPRDPMILDLALQALARMDGHEVVTRLRDAILARDADDIGDPFSEPAVEAAARRLVEMVYTGEILDSDGTETAIAYHQALGWQVLRFTKPPSVCGPGFGWWNDPPSMV